MAAGATRDRPRADAAASRRSRSAVRRVIHAGWRDPRWSWAAPTVAATLVAAAYLLIDPRTDDLPAHLFRSGLFDRAGFTIWSNQWYGGHHTPAYSVLGPPLMWLLGPRLAGALAAVAAAILFERLVRERFGDKARFGALWLGIGVGTLLFTDRLTFALGVPLGLAAVLALARGRPWAAAGLGGLASLASPVAGLFAALAGAAYALGTARGEPGRPRWRSWSAGLDGGRAGLGLAAAALAPILALALVFPATGPQPFVASAYVAVPLFAVAALVLLPREASVLRAGVVLYLAGATAAFLLETGLGGNVTRLGSLLAGPLLAAALLGPGLTRVRTVLVAVTLAGLAYWQWAPAVGPLVDAHGDPSRQASYYEPLLDRLERRPPAGRLEIPPLRNHFESAYVAERFPLARGWERQLDTERNPLFYEGELTHAGYRSWLRENAVSHVALADAPVDYSSEAERRLVTEEPPYLEPVWRSESWRLYEVLDPEPLVTPEEGAEVAQAGLDDSSFALDFAAPGAALVRVRWTPYWLAEGACVEPAGQWTRVSAEDPGVVRVAPVFAPERIASEARRCG